MEVILLEKIHNLGALGDKVRVKPGYGRNYLIPRKKAVPATADNIAKFEARRAELEAQQQATLAEAQTRANARAKIARRLAHADAPPTRAPIWQPAPTGNARAPG